MKPLSEWMDDHSDTIDFIIYGTVWSLIFIAGMAFGTISAIFLLGFM